MSSETLPARRERRKTKARALTKLDTKNDNKKTSDLAVLSAGACPHKHKGIKREGGPGRIMIGIPCLPAEIFACLCSQQPIYGRIYVEKKRSGRSGRSKHTHTKK